jgi:hypothetical protein
MHKGQHNHFESQGSLESDKLDGKPTDCVKTVTVKAGAPVKQCIEARQVNDQETSLWGRATQVWGVR